MSFNVLIVEDEPIPAAYLKTIIEDNSKFKVLSIAQSANDAFIALKNNSFDVICLDIMLKGAADGARAAIEIRDRYPQIEIVFLTVYSEDEMLEFASEAKAFAYLLKPYRPEEIKATFKLLESKLKQNPLHQIKDSIVKLISNYKFDTDKKLLYKDNQEIPLSKKELDFLHFLCQNPNSTLHTDTILNRLNITDTSLRSIIYRIRKATTKDLIISAKKYGYKVATL